MQKIKTLLIVSGGSIDIDFSKEYIKDKENQIGIKNALIQEMKLKIESLKTETMTVGLRMYRELQTYDKINTIKKYVKEKNKES